MAVGFPVREAMTMNPIVCSKDITVSSALNLMDKKRVGSLLVVEDKKLLGIFTEKDILKKIVMQKRNPDSTKVSEVMSTKLITIPPDEDIFDAAKIMLEKDIRRLPVVDKNNLLGLVTEKDLLRMNPDVIDIIIEKKRVRDASHKRLTISRIQGICESCGEFTTRLLECSDGFLCPECIESHGHQDIE